MIDGEPVRGSIPPPWFSALSGIDRVRAFSQGLLLAPPLARLQGIRAAHVGPGSGTWTMPASAWLQSWTGFLEISAFIETALTGVTLTAAPPGVAVVPRTLAINYFRPNRPQAGNLLARGRVVNTSRFFAFTELEIEDPEGRHIGHAAGQSALRPVEPPPPPPPSRLLPVEEPLYSTADPYLRSVAHRVDTVEEWERHGGFAIMREYANGTRKAPLTELCGIRLLAVDEGRAVTTLAASEWFGQFSRNVAPGILASLRGPPGLRWPGPPTGSSGSRRSFASTGTYPVTAGRCAPSAVRSQVAAICPWQRRASTTLTGPSSRR